MDVFRKIRGSSEPEDSSPLPELDIDPEEWLNDREILDGGAYRRDDRGASWWLPTKELAKYEEVNNSDTYEDNDEGFWEWFETFRKERRLKTGRAAVWDYGEGIKKSYDSDSYFRSLWTSKGWGLKASTYGSEETTEMATALGFVQTLVQAVRTKAGRYNVSFATSDKRDAPTSYSDFDHQQIVISPQAALDKKIDQDRRIRITTGWALHEAAHTEHTVDRWPVLTKPLVMKPPQVASTLLNIAEDVRIESKMGVNFPGFADYFEESRQYLFEIGDEKKDIGKMPENLGEMMTFIIRTIRWPDKLEPELTEDAREEFDWWANWHEQYKPLTGNPKIREHLEKAMNRLAAMFRPEMEKLTEEWEEKEKEAGGVEGAIRRLIDELTKKFRSDHDIPEPCSGRAAGKIEPDAAEEIERKLDEEWEIEPASAHRPDTGGIRSYDMLIKKPSLPDGVRYEPDRGPMSRRLRASFILRPAKPEYSDRLLRNGSIDEEELWRWGAGDFRVFEQKIRETAPDTDITLLVDESGSMYDGSKMPVARRLAQLMLDCLANMSGVNVRVRGHTGQNGEFPSGIVINRIWEPGDDMARIGLLEADAQNMDGFAIEWCVRELLAGRPNTQKILIVLADGEPYGHGYSGAPAERHVREVVTKAERNGVFVIQLGVGHGIREDEQRRMFNHYIKYTDDETLLRDLASLMSKLF